MVRPLAVLEWKFSTAEKSNSLSLTVNVLPYIQTVLGGCWTEGRQ